MHDVAVALDEELVGDLDGADLGNAADVVAAEIEQHQMLGALLRVGQELVLQRLVLVRRRAARPGAGERPDRHRAVAQPHQHLRARPGDGVAAEVEEIQKRRRIDPPQRAVERERRQRERRLEALRQHHLENIAGQDVVLGLLHHGPVFGGRGVGFRRDVERRRARWPRPPCRAAGRAHRPRRRAAPRARASAAFAVTPGSGRTGVTTVICPSPRRTPRSSVGRISTASGMPIGSGWAAGSSSISRTMS